MVEHRRAIDTIAPEGGPAPPSAESLYGGVAVTVGGPDKEGPVTFREEWTPLPAGEVPSLLVVGHHKPSQEALEFLKSHQIEVQVVPVAPSTTAAEIPYPRLVTSSGRYTGLRLIKRAVEFALARRSAA